MLKKGDIILYGLFVLTAVFSWFFTADPLNRHTETLTAQIKVDGKLLYSIDLNSTPAKTLELPGKYHLSAEIEKGRIRVSEARCPDKICVKTGWLYREGDTSVCIPNRTVVTVTGKKRKVDAVSQ